MKVKKVKNHCNPTHQEMDDDISLWAQCCLLQLGEYPRVDLQYPVGVTSPITPRIALEEDFSLCDDDSAASPLGDATPWERDGKISGLPREDFQPAQEER